MFRSNKGMTDTEGMLRERGRPDVQAEALGGDRRDCLSSAGRYADPVSWAGAGLVRAAGGGWPWKILGRRMTVWDPRASLSTNGKAYWDPRAA